MASLIRFTKFSNVYNLYKNSVWNRKCVFAPKLQTKKTQQNIIRGFCVATLQENFDFASKSRQFGDLDAHIHRLDRILRKGGFLRKKILDDVHYILKETKNVTPSQSLFLLRCCGGTFNLESAEIRNKLVGDIWTTYKEIGIPVDISHYNALLQVYLENEHQFSPLDFLSTLNEKNIEPNRITYSRLIARYCQEGDIEGANKILEFMKEKQMPINENIFNSLIMGNGRANDLEGARNIIEVMKQTEITPGPESYSVLLLAYAEHGDIENMNNLLSQCEKEEINIYDKGLMEVIYALATKNFSVHIPEVLSKIKRSEGYATHATSVICRLLYAGYDEIAFEIYKSLPINAELQYMWQFFPKQLALADLPIQKIANYCQEIYNNGWNVGAFQNALEMFLLNGKYEGALALMRVMLENKIPVREHFFYPIFCHLREAGDREKSFQLLEEILKMEIKFSRETISTYIIPCFNPSGTVEDSENIYLRLLNFKDYLEINLVYNGIVEYLLKNHGVEPSAQFVNRYRRGIRWFLSRLLVSKYLISENTKDTVCILRQMLPLSVRVNGSNAREVADDNEQAEDVGYEGIKNFLVGVISSLKAHGTLDQLMPLLKSMEKEGVGISGNMMEQLIAEIGPQVTNEIKNILFRLANPSLIPTNYRRQGQENYVPLKTLIQRIQDEENGNGEASEKLNISYLLSLVRQNNVEGVEEQLEKMKNLGISISPMIQAMLISLYIEAGKLESVEAIFNQLKDHHPEFQVQAFKVIKYANLLANSNRIQDAIKALLMHSPEDGIWNEESCPNYEDRSYCKIINNMLMSLVDKKDLASLQLMQESLLSRKYCFPSYIFSPLVKYYLQEDNLEEALNAFERLSEEHKIAPSKEELTVACIHKEDTEKLQRIINVSTKVFGEMNTFYDLMFTFIDLGKVKQAKKILETSGLRTLQNRLDLKCEYYLRNGKITELEVLVSITKDLFNVNRQTLYNILLDGYISQENASKALGIWTLMQEEGIEPTDQFLTKLSNFLYTKDVEVPFVVPSRVQTYNTSVGSSLSIPKQQHKEKQFSNLDKELSYALDHGDLNSAHQILKRAESEKVEFNQQLTSRLIGLELKKNNLQKAIDNTKKLIIKSEFPSQTVIRNLIEKLGEVGDVETIKFFEKYMNYDVKRKCLYDYHLGVAYVNSKRAEELLNSFLKNAEEGSFEREGLTRGVTTKIICQEPDLYPLLEKCAEVEKTNGKNILHQWMWDQAFSEGNTALAERIYEKCIKDLDEIEVKTTCAKAYAQKDIQLLEDALKVIDKKPPGRSKTKGTLYSAYVDILRTNGKYKEAIELIDKTLIENIRLEHYLFSTLRKLKHAMEDQKMTFPYQIGSTVRNKLRSSSSSDSDDK